MQRTRTPSTATRRLAAYLRVSTDLQAEKGHGLGVQRAAIKDWAKQHGHVIALWASDQGTSGSAPLEAREGLLEAIGAVKAGDASGIVVYRLDRLARDLMVQETILADLRRGGGDLYSTSAGEQDFLTDDEADPSRKLIRQILGAVAEYERAMIRLRLRAGKHAKRAQGGYIGGKIPIGYRLTDDGLLVIDEAEQQAIRRMRELRSQGSTIRGIRDALSADGLYPRSGGEWSLSVISSLVAAAG